ncbi:MAG: hypothetical protein ACI9DJ_001335 [Algoriphagus sp.]|jgi:hypothetical protein
MKNVNKTESLTINCGEKFTLRNSWDGLGFWNGDIKQNS